MNFSFGSPLQVDGSGSETLVWPPQLLPEGVSTSVVSRRKNKAWILKFVGLVG